MSLFVRDATELDALNISLPDMQQAKYNLSSGLNHLDIPAFYLDFLREELDYKQFMKDYSEGAGTRILVESLKSYEKLVSGLPFPVQDNKYADHLAVTAGASMAIVHLIEYLAVHCSSYRFLFLGFNYFLFFQLMNKYELPYTLLTSAEGRNYHNAPTVDEIKREILQNNGPIAVFLSMPCNPSGENYSIKEVEEIIALLKAIPGSLLIIDKCQQDELHLDSYVNVGHLIAKAKFEDQAIVINSFSKTRSIPGIRLGYITGNESIIRYIILNIKYSYYCHSQLFIFPIIADLLIRLLFICEYYGLEADRLYVPFNKAVARHSGISLYTRYLRGILTKVRKSYADYAKPITQNYKIIQENYVYSINQLEALSAGYTKLSGGFNFSIQFKGLEARNQLNHCAEIVQSIGLLLMPECYFNGSVIRDSTGPFSFRITLAYPQAKFQKMIELLKDYLLNSLSDNSKQCNEVHV